MQRTLVRMGLFNFASSSLNPNGFAPWIMICNRRSSVGMSVSPRARRGPELIDSVEKRVPKPAITTPTETMYGLGIIMCHARIFSFP
jgi:hypothetical protein